MQPGIVALGGTPGNPLSATWQGCADTEVANHAGLSIVAKADTNWTQEGNFEAVSGLLAQRDDIGAYIYEYADGFRGGVRAYEAANRPMDLILSLRTDEQGLFCDWEKVNNPNFKIRFVGNTSSGDSNERANVDVVEVTATDACGDGVVDSWEQCDDGNTTAGDCCSPTCQFESSATVCRAATGECDVAETCTGSSATCPANAESTSTSCLPNRS